MARGGIGATAGAGGGTAWNSRGALAKGSWSAAGLGNSGFGCGGIATHTSISSWLLGFALFFFLSLAFVKRYTELLAAAGWLESRGYRVVRFWNNQVLTETESVLEAIALALAPSP